MKITFLDSDPNTYNKSPKDPSGKINVGLQNLLKKILKGDGGVGTFDVGGGALPSFLIQIFQFFGCAPN